MVRRVPLLLVLSLVPQTHACSSTNETIPQGGGAGGGGGSSNAGANPGSGGSDAASPAGGGGGGSSGSAPVGMAGDPNELVGDERRPDMHATEPGAPAADGM